MGGGGEDREDGEQQQQPLNICSKNARGSTDNTICGCQEAGEGQETHSNEWKSLSLGSLICKNQRPGGGYLYRLFQL